MLRTTGLALAIAGSAAGGGAAQDGGGVLEVTARAQGCDVAEGYCAFYLPGLWLTAWYGEGSAEPIMRTLESFGMGDLVDLRAVVVTSGSAHADVVVLKAAPSLTPDPHRDLHGALQGAWRAITDPQAVRYFEGSVMMDLHAGEFMEESYFEVVDGCDGWEGTALAVITPAWGSRDCFGIVEVTAERLHLVYEARGNDLVYSRAD